MNPVKMAHIELSDYVKSLSNEDLAFYIEKLTIDGEVVPDPYKIPTSDWENEVRNWPDITYPDIYQ